MGLDSHDISFFYTKTTSQFLELARIIDKQKKYIGGGGGTPPARATPKHGDAVAGKKLKNFRGPASSIRA